jgi:putative two-component system response regulator
MTTLDTLIVDDDEISLDMLEHTLTRAGHRVTTARSGEEALTALERREHRFVVTDWEMPGLSGIDLCRAIRAGDWGGYVYTVLLTSHQTREERIQGLTAGADDFIGKPFDAEELLARLRIGERVLSLETREVAIFALAKLAESRDTDTGRHLERVQRYSRVLAQYLAKNPKFEQELDAEFIRLIYLTSPLHDIGKVGIPDSVLLKPGRLSDDEFDIMKTHTTIGADTLAAALEQFPGARFLEMGRDIAATHHERWDGKGYPRQLAGEQIPLGGRIVAVADVFDALTSKRVYKAAFTPMVAKNIIVQDSGKHFDPDVVEAFLACEQEFARIYERLRDQ